MVEKICPIISAGVLSNPGFVDMIDSVANCMESCLKEKCALWNEDAVCCALLSNYTYIVK